MTKLIRDRLLLLIPMVLGIIFIVFFLTSLLPSSPGRLMLGANASQVEVDKLNEQLGYNKPFFARYLDYVWNMVQGHRGDDEVETLSRWRVGEQVELQGRHVAHP